LAPSLYNIVLLDLCVWLACSAVLLRFANLSITHPATTYLVFHGWLVSSRAIAILNGAATIFSWRGASPVTQHEILRAVLLADVALITMTSAWVVAAHRASRFGRKQTVLGRLRLEIIRGVAWIAIPAGVVAMLLWSRLPGFPSHGPEGEWAASSWIVVAQTWAGLALLALIYWYGFRPLLVLSLGIYLAVVIYQGGYRFRLLIAVILLVQIYVDRQRRRWPKLSVVGILVLSGLLFFPLKGIGRQLQAGEPADQIWQSMRHSIADALSGNHPDEMILDEFAAALSLADQHGKLYWGSTYLGLMTVAVPRQWWPDKPGLADFEKDISTAERPFAASGMVVTMLGEFYLNFSYAGVVLLSFLVAYFMGRWYCFAYRHGYFTVARFMYLIVACSLIQVYRDGLISLFVFTVINMMPLSVIALLHIVLPSSEPVALPRRPILSAPRVRVRDQEQPVA
jgi:hypothetical protein